MNKFNDNQLKGIKNMESYENGIMKSCIVGEENRIRTVYGELIPQFSSAQYGERQKKYRSSIAYYQNGQMKSVALEKQVQILTPIGNIKAELVTFYEDGSLKRLFPLNGKIDGFWSEEDEGQLCETYKLDLPNLIIKSKIIGLNFYRDGGIKSITLWPGEVIEVKINETIILVRNGLSFYEDGRLKSLEPALKTLVKTPIGNMYAYDKDAIGIHGDSNSLVFSKEGDVICLTTSHSGVKVHKKNSQRIQWLEPLIIDSIIDDDEKTILPLKVNFYQHKIEIKDDHSHTFDINENTFTVYIPMIDEKMSCSDCSSCTSCG